MLRKGILLVLSLSLLGCLSQKYNIRQLERDSVCVVFEQQIEMPDQLHVKATNVHGFRNDVQGSNLNEVAIELGVYFAIHVVAEMIDILKYGTPTDMISKHMTDHKIYVDKMLLEQFKQAFRHKTNLDECNGRPTGSFVKVALRVKKIGLHQVSGRSPLLRPIMNLSVVLSNEHNKVVWSYFKRFRRKNSEVAAYSMQSYMLEPENLKLAYESLFEHAVGDVMQGFY